MRIKPWMAGLGLLALAAVATTIALSAQSGGPSARDLESGTIPRSASARTPETIIREWPECARSAALAMIEKYGQPKWVSVQALVWYNNGPWQKTVVYRKAWPNSLAARDKDYLEQTIFYQVPNDKINTLKDFNPRIAVNKAREELSSRSESESMNTLALNLADEIITDKRSARNARIFYRDIERLSQSGKTSPYMERLLFTQFGESSPNPEYPGLLNP